MDQNAPSSKAQASLGSSKKAFVLSSKKVLGGLALGSILVLSMLLSFSDLLFRYTPKKDTKKKDGNVPAQTHLGGLKSEFEPTPDSGAMATSKELETGDASTSTPLISKRFRVSSLKDQNNVKYIESSMGKQTFIQALTKHGVSSKQVFLLLKTFRKIKEFNKAKSSDLFRLALDQTTGRLIGFEYESGLDSIWQATSLSPDSDLIAKKLDIKVVTSQTQGVLNIKTDVEQAIKDASLDVSLSDSLKNALRDHQSELQRGARIRWMGSVVEVDGEFSKYGIVEAAEYNYPHHEGEHLEDVPPPIRVYYMSHFKDVSKGAYYNERAQRPLKGVFRKPVAFSRVTSRFDMKRMHPVLHRVKPHNGVDFSAPLGTAVYASAKGKISQIGNGGPCGNMVQITHALNYISVYCHLSKFAPHLKVDTNVEQNELIAYSGQSGRTSGPHLHFGIKKGGRFIDPLALKLDGYEVIEKKMRPAFEQKKKELDVLLDQIPLPEAVIFPVQPSPVVQDEVDDLQSPPK